MGICSISNVFEDAPLEYHAVLAALTDQPWQVDGRVDAD